MFRVDASVDMGSGHVMRCLTLADELKASGYTCHFITRQQPGDLNSMIASKGHILHTLPERSDTKPGKLLHSNWLKGGQINDFVDCENVIKELLPDWLIIDHYGIDAEWERRAAAYSKRILVIDDLGDRAHECDLLLDQNLGAHPDKYENLVPKNCKILAGCSFALLRNEFSNYRKRSLEYRKNKKEIDTILVTMGGFDKDNYTEKVLDAIESSSLKRNIKIIIILSKSAPSYDSVKNRIDSSHFNMTLLSNAGNMGEIMCQADLAIGAAGSTSWERCCLGLPTILCVIAENQRFASNSLSQHGAAICLDPINVELSTQEILIKLMDDPVILRRLSNNSSTLVDGLGTKRVLKQILTL